MRLTRHAFHWILAVVLGGVLATYQMAPMWEAWWGLMDDAEYVGMAPRGQSLQARDFVTTLAQTEVGRIGSTTRFRPVYYLLRVGERMVWPPSPRWYYAARTVMFAVALSLSAWALFASLGTVLGAGIFAMVSTAWFWRDIWAHGGPAEQYGFLGTSLLAVSCVVAWSEPRLTHARTVGLVAVAGTVLAMGSKENFLILVVPSALLLLRIAKTPPDRYFAFGLLAIVVCCAASIVAAILPGLQRAGTDMYGAPIAPTSRLAWIHSTLGLQVAAAAIATLAIPPSAWRILPAQRKTAESRERHDDLARRLYAQIGLVLLLVASQATFYSPKWPTFGSRYDFPGMLALPLGLASLAVFVRSWLTVAGAGTRLVRGATFGAALFALSLGLRHGVAPVRAAAELAARHTQTMRVALASAVRQAGHGSASIPIVVEWHTGFEVEPARSVLRLLHELGGDGPFFMRGAADARARGPLADVWRDRRPLRWWNDVTVQPPQKLAAALAASRGAAVIVNLDDYAVPRIRRDTLR